MSLDRAAILYFGNDWDAENRTSSHHVARSLARSHRVLYFECPGLRPPKQSRRDLRKIFHKIARFFRGRRVDSSGVVVRTLLQVPLHHLPAVKRLNSMLLVWSVRWAMWRERVREPILWFLVPHAVPLVGKLGEALAVYYCIDDYAALPDVDVQAVAAMDAELTARADLVFVAAETLLAEKQRLNPRTYVSPHGVDYAHFSAAQKPDTAVPADISHYSRPILGFFGLLEQWIDLDLIAYAAERRSEWTFVLIGRVAVDNHLLPMASNIKYLGWRPYESLPAYGKAFDVALIPYKLTQQVLNANPMKLREYLAIGKPIVSVSTPEIDKFASVIRIARSKQEFLARLDEAVRPGEPPAQVRRRMELAEGMGWDRRVDVVLSHVDQALRRKSLEEPSHQNELAINRR